MHFPPRLQRIPEDNESIASEDYDEQRHNELVMVPEEELPIKDFEPMEKQRHFGLLHLSVTSKFRRMMVIGMVNVILVIVFFLFILFFIELHRDNTIVIMPSTPKPATTELPGWCGGFYQYFHNKCLYQNRATDHIKAERTTTELGAYLVTMHSKQDLEIVREFINGTGGVWWIGMYCSGNNITNCVWDDSTTVEFDSFANGHPNISQGICVSYNLTDDKWYSTDCSMTLPQISEMPVMRGPPSSCKDILGEFCYILVLDVTSFYEAAFNCESLCGQLVSIHSTEENQFILTMFRDLPHLIYALGGYATSKNSIIWVDGTPMDFNNLETFNGPGCLYTADYDYADGNWFTGDCSRNTSYICKKPVNVECPTRVTVATTPKVLASCNSSPLQVSGSFTSPNFPNPYPSYTSCTWTLVTYGPQKISLTFEKVQIGKDKITVYDGDSRTGNFLGTLTDTQTRVINTVGNVAYIIFEAGSNDYDFAGFNASFITVYY